MAFKPEEKVKKCFNWVQKQTLAAISPTLRRVWHGILWHFPVPPHSLEWETFRHSFPAIIDQRMQTSIGREYPRIIDAARESAIARSDKSLDRRVSMNCQMRTLLHFHLMSSIGRSFFKLRGNFQSSMPNSTRNVHALSAFDCLRKSADRGVYRAWK